MSSLRVVVFGASGIIGQHMMLCVPRGIDARFYRHEEGPLFRAVDLTAAGQPEAELDAVRPDVVINLAGESRVDVVEKDPGACWFLNVDVPRLIGKWCDRHGAHYIHISSQAVFSGLEAPYSPDAYREPVNAYGVQKWRAETSVACGNRWTIVRPTFVLGIRPLPYVGRRNPLESALEDPEQRLVNDRWFSPLFASSAARSLWELALAPPMGAIIHLGLPIQKSRYEIAVDMLATSVFRPPVTMVALETAPTIIPVSHDDFPGIARRPVNTTWGAGAWHHDTYDVEVLTCVLEWEARMSDLFPDRACELALFLQQPEADVIAKLGLGFIPLHHEVAADFRRANPQSDDELLAWYRATESYIWELSAYHLDAGWNYDGMCRGIVEHLKTRGVETVLCVGDGIGTLSIRAAEAGLVTTYHDLAGSRTAAFASHRFWRRNLDVRRRCTAGWIPWIPILGHEEFDAITVLDFMEHMTDVPAWARAVYDALKPGGIVLFQNAFGIGDDDHGGSIPSHLTRNGRFETDWDPLLDEIGFVRDGETGWRKKP